MAKKIREEGEILAKKREEREILAKKIGRREKLAQKSREEGDLLSCPSPLILDRKFLLFSLKTKSAINLLTQNRQILKKVPADCHSKSA